jgi:glycosyltransferase involved in cell wall biosynthesis
VVVADDGSGEETEALVRAWKRAFGERLTHVWHEDEGARKSLARNRGALAARGDYLVFLDGDCVPRRRFVSALRRAAVRGWFLAGKRLLLTPELTKRVTHGGAHVWRWSTPRLVLSSWSHLDRPVHLTPRDRRRPWRDGLPDFLPEDNAYGFVMAMFRDDLERVNGFDTRFVGWGEQDLDLATRLLRSGLRCGYAGPETTVLHLWHEPRGRPDRENWWLHRETLESGRVEAPEGLRETSPDGAGSGERCAVALLEGAGVDASAGAQPSRIEKSYGITPLCGSIRYLSGFSGSYGRVGKLTRCASVSPQF